MAQATPELLRELCTVAFLIAALDAAYPDDDEDAEDLCWLRARKRFISTLLATRSAQRDRKIVSLAFCRHGPMDERSALAA